MDNREKRKVTVSILGSPISVLTDDEQERVDSVAAFVDNMIRQIKAANPFINNFNAAVLALLNISDELLTTKEELESVKTKVDEEGYQIMLNYKDRLSTAMEEIEKNEEKIQSLESRLERMELENRELTSLIEEYRNKFNSLRNEFEMNKRSLADMQNKLIESQIELVQTRKSLLDE